MKKKSNFRILIVEDQDDQWVIEHKAFARIWPEAGLTWVASAESALQLLIEGQHQEWNLPHLVLLDLYLPRRENGMQVLQAIRQFPIPFNQLPVILLTYSSDRTDIQEAYQQGVTSYLVKPSNGEEWFSHVGQLKSYWLNTAILPPIQYRV